jgi:hypothetical protein
MISLSIVIPYFRKITELRIALPHNARYLCRSNVELVLVLDEPSQEREVLALLDQLPQVRARVVVNDRPHDWRPPCVAINVGIRAAKGKFVLVVSPESVFVGDVPSNVLQVLFNRSSDVLLGRVAWATFAEAHGRSAEALFSDALAVRGRLYFGGDYFGSIAASRDLFQAVRGYDESLQLWGGDDENIRSRMSMHGAMLMLDRRLRVVHLSETLQVGAARRELPSHAPNKVRELINPAEVVANPEQWGVEFGRVARDWVENMTTIQVTGTDS